MKHIDQVIEAAKKGMAESGFPMTNELENLLRIVYLAGFNEALRTAAPDQEQK